MANLAAIKAEIQNDPVTIGYGTWAQASDDTRIQALLNDASKRSLAHVIVAGWQVVDCFDPTEFAALTQLQLSRLSTVLAPGSVDLANSNVRTLAAAIFPSGGPTRTALAALWTAQQQTQSRALELGLGATIEDVAAARLS